MSNNLTFDGGTMVLNGTLGLNGTMSFNGTIVQGRIGQIGIPAPLAADGWYQLGTVSNAPGRGAARLIISYLGNLWTPTTYVIDAYKDYIDAPSTGTTLALQKFGTQDYIKEARLVYDGNPPAAGVWSLEGLFSANASGHTASVYTQYMLGNSTEWRFRTGTIPATTLTTDPTNTNWAARATFPVGNGGSTLERLNIQDNRAGRYWSLTDNSSPTQYQLQINDNADTIMQFDGTLNKVSIGTTAVPTAQEGTLRVAGATMSNLLDVYQTAEPNFRYRVRALGSQIGYNPDIVKLGLNQYQPVYSTGLFYDANSYTTSMETAAIKFWRGGAAWDGAITLNTLGTSATSPHGTASERVIIKQYGEVMINAGQFFTASQIWLQQLGASASLNVFPVTTGNAGPYALALYAGDIQWPILTKNTTAANQPDQFFVRHSSTDVHMGNARTGGLLIMTQSNVGVSTNLIVGAHTVPGAKLDVRATATVPLIIASGSSTDDLVRITQTGTGNAFVVEDEAGDTSPFVITAGGTVSIGATSAFVQEGNKQSLDRLNVQGRSYLTGGIHSFTGLNTALTTDNWYRICQFGEISNTFDFATFQMRVDVGGPSDGLQISADVYVNYKQQNTDHRVYVNIINYGSLALSSQDFEVLRNDATQQVTLYIRLRKQYQIPDYTYSGAVPTTLVNLGTLVGANLTGETNNAWLEKSIVNGLTSNPITNVLTTGTVSATNYLYTGLNYASTAMRYAKSVPGLTSSVFTNLFRVDGDTLASGVRASFTGTVGSSVTNVVVDILVNHFEDIYVESISGNYTELTLRIISNRDMSFVVQGRSNQGNTSPTYTDLRIEVFPLSSETVTFDSITIPTGAGGETTTHVHVCGVNGKTISATGSGAGAYDIGGLSLSGRLGVGRVPVEVYPSAKFHVNNDSNAVSMLVEDSANVDSTPFAISDLGNVSIGTMSTTVKLDLYGSMNIVSGLGNNSPRPAITAQTREFGEIRGYSSTPFGNGQGYLFNDGFLRISAGGGLDATTKAYIDLSGFSNVDDMNSNIVLGAGGQERMRILNNGNVGIGLTGPTADLHVRNSVLNATVVRADGVAGELFTVTDSLSGSLFSVNDVSGVPVLEAFSDNTIVMGDYQAPALFTTTKAVRAAGVANSTIFQLSATTYNTAFFDYNVTSGNNSRSGTIMAVWNAAGVIEFNETSTMDIGTGTLAISFDVFVSGTNVLLRSTTAAGGGTWTIKVMVRAI